MMDNIKTVKNRMSPYKFLVRVIESIFHDKNMVMNDKMRMDIPRKWEIHGDLMLVSDAHFKSEHWAKLDENDWLAIARVVKCKRIAQKSSICDDDFRSPRVRLILSSSGWVDHVDNGIRYSYDVTECMFSAGNISEKLRVSQFDCRGETVVDLFAGIGYFVLPYLIHARAEFVHACEWNPRSVAALRHNVRHNRVEDRCEIHEGDNRLVCPQNVADRVNLGLIPSSERAWAVACSALRSESGGILHIHGNVNTKSDMEKTNTSNDLYPIKCNRIAGVAEKECPDQGSDFSNSRTKNRGSPTGNFENIEDVSRAVSSPSESHSESLHESGHRSSLKNNSTALPNPKSLNGCTTKQSRWRDWAESTRAAIIGILSSLYGENWTVAILDVVRVKKYAPHIDHVVVDLRCTPIGQCKK